MFADDAIVEDPIGPSAFDLEGKGHRGRDAISAFWDLAIANTTKIEFFFRDTYQCGNEEIADARLGEGHPVAWIHATALRTEPLAFSGRDQVSPQAGRDAAAALWKAAGITSPIDEIDAAEIYVPFSWFEPMWLENLGFAPEGDGWKLTEAGETRIGGRLPVNPSGGVLSSNPIGASGLIRFAESAIQVMGKGGDHQVPDARKALGHAYGGGSQYYSMWVVAADKPEKVHA